MSTPEARRPDKAIEKRRAESDRKRDAVMTVIAEHVSSNIPVTVTALAKQVGVSREFIYNNLFDEVSNAQDIQKRQGIGAGPSTSHPAAQPGLRTDLQLAQQEIARLRSENATLKRQRDQSIGARLEARTTTADDRVAEKQQEVERLLSERQQAAATIAGLRRQVQRLEDDLAAERSAHTATAALLADDTENVVPLR